MARRFATLAALALAGACATADALYFGQQQFAIYSTQSVGYAQSLGPVPVTVLGQPFAAAPPDALARAVAGAMSGANAGPALTFTADPPPPREADFRAVVVFGTAWATANQLCLGIRPEISPSGERLRAEAAFCVGGTLVTVAKGEMLAPVTGLEDPAFARFVRGLTLSLLPPVQRLGRVGTCSPVMNC
jgi:hypothetical protein